MKKKKTISIGKVFFNVPVALILIIIALLVLVPVIWMTFSAFKTEREIISWPPTFIPKTFTLENFVDVQVTRRYIWSSCAPVHPIGYGFNAALLTAIAILLMAVGSQPGIASDRRGRMR